MFLKIFLIFLHLFDQFSFQIFKQALNLIKMDEFEIAYRALVEILARVEQERIKLETEFSQIRFKFKISKCLICQQWVSLIDKDNVPFRNLLISCNCDDLPLIVHLKCVLKEENTFPGESFVKKMKEIGFKDSEEGIFYCTNCKI